jgi:hypothetical protein
MIAQYKWLGIGLIIATGLVHLTNAQEYYGEVPYIGVLFVVNAIGALVAAVGIQRDTRWGWGLGFLMAGGPFLAYVLSRSVGIPGFRENSWEQFTEPMGLLSLSVEGMFVLVAAMLFTMQQPPAAPRRFSQ